jgi:hypothetical protein
MEATFIFFSLDDAFGGTIKREKLKASIHKKLSYKMKDEK